MKEVIELIENDTRAHSNCPPLAVESADLPIVPGKIDDQAIPKRAAGEAGPCPPGRDGDVRIGGCEDYVAGLLCAARKGDCGRLDLIKRGVGRVCLASPIIERDLAVRRGKSPLL